MPNIKKECIIDKYEFCLILQLTTINQNIIKIRGVKMFSITSGFTFLAAAATTATSSAASASASTLTTIMSFAPFVLIIIAFYFIAIRPQKKKEKEVVAMRNNLQVGDQITTSGGIVGRVVSIKDDSVTIETGTDRVKIRVMRWAISVNNTTHDA